jgi:hypothetical protein
MPLEQDRIMHQDNPSHLLITWRGQGESSHLDSEDDPHSHAQECCCVCFASVGG